MFGCALLTSYLVLFIDFYFRTYGKKRSDAAKQVNGISKASPEKTSESVEYNSAKESRKEAYKHVANVTVKYVLQPHFLSEFL